MIVLLYNKFGDSILRKNCLQLLFSPHSYTNSPHMLDSNRYFIIPGLLWHT